MRVLIATLIVAGCGGETAPELDAPALDAAAGLPTTCDGACQALTLRASFGGTVRDFEQAYFGISRADDPPTLHVEAYRGGAAGCPSGSSPTPDYTLVVAGLPRPTAAAALTAQANLLDFQGDLLGGALGAQATAVTLTPTAAGDQVLALDAAITFAAGTVSGHLYATHCASLDD